MQSEKEQILAEFEQAYADTKTTPRALYGIGANTIYLLENLQGYNIVCIMDKASEGQTLNGYDIYSPEQVVGLVDEIVVIARYSSSEIIYNRIKDIEKHNIKVKSYDGKPLSEIFIDRGNLSEYIYSDYSYSELKKEIENTEIISFDMFGTLVNRIVLLPTDIFTIVELELELLKQKLDVNFKETRIQAEKNAHFFKQSATNYDDIYSEFQKLTGLDTSTIDTIKELEFNIELEYIIPRESAVDLLRYALSLNKPVYVLSDMYLNKTYLKQILDKCEITGYNDIIVSCDYGASKSNGMLFDLFSQKVNNHDILHIGDNYYDDILTGEKHGIKTFYYIHYYDMIKKSNINFLLCHVKNISDSLLLGTTMSKYFDSPFALNKFNGKLFISNVDMLADICIIPILLKFMLFSIDFYKTFDKARVIYVARDGYLLDKIHNIITKDLNLPKSEYVLASRRAMLVPNIETEEDILLNLKNISIQTPKEYEVMIYERFGIHLDLSNYSSVKIEELQQEILANKDKIYENAKVEKNEYINYLKQFNFADDEEIIVFDLVTSGTVFNNLSKILNRKINPLCFATINLNENDYHSLFGNINGYDKEKFFIISSFFLFENILTQPKGQFVKFSNGVPIFREEDSKTEEFLHYQNYVVNQTAKLMQEYNFDDLNVYLVDSLLKLITKNYSKVDANLKKYLYINDPFTGRDFDVNDLISYADNN